MGTKLNGKLNGDKPNGDRSIFTLKLNGDRSIFTQSENRSVPIKLVPIKLIREAMSRGQWSGIVIILAGVATLSGLQA